MCSWICFKYLVIYSYYLFEKLLYCFVVAYNILAINISSLFYNLLAFLNSYQNLVFRVYWWFFTFVILTFEINFCPIPILCKFWDIQILLKYGLAIFLPVSNIDITDNKIGPIKSLTEFWKCKSIHLTLTFSQTYCVEPIYFILANSNLHWIGPLGWFSL